MMGIHPDVVKAREVMHNIKAHSFDACGNYKVDEKEAKKIVELLEHYVAGLGYDLFEEENKA